MISLVHVDYNLWKCKLTQWTQITYHQNTWNDVQCSDKYGKACYVKHCMCVYTEIHKRFSLLIGPNDVCIMTLRYIPLFVAPNIIPDGLTNRLSIRQLWIVQKNFTVQTYIYGEIPFLYQLHFHDLPMLEILLLFNKKKKIFTYIKSSTHILDIMFKHYVVPQVM